MPHGTETAYDVASVAQMLNTSPDGFIEFLNREKLLQEKPVSSPRHKIPTDSLWSVFDAYFRVMDLRPHYWSVPPSLTECSSRWARALAEIYAKPYTFPISMSPEQGLMLRALMANLRPRTVVEIGTCLGVSTIWMASALQEAGVERTTIHAVDMFGSLMPFVPIWNCHVRNQLQVVREHLELAGVSHLVELHPGRSEVIGTKLAREIPTPIDFLFIDGDHTVPGATRDFDLYSPHVALGGYVLFHDTNPISGWDGPRHLIEHRLRGSQEYEMIELGTAPLSFGLGLARKVGGKVSSTAPGLTASFLQNNTWAMGRNDGSNIAEIQLLPDGTIGGIPFHHPNEARWEIRDGVLHFLNEAGAPSTVFSCAADCDGKRVLTGRWYNTGILHVLRQV